MEESKTLIFFGGVKSICAIGDKLRILRPVEGHLLEEDLNILATVIGFAHNDPDGEFVRVSHPGFSRSPHSVLRQRLAVTWYADRFEPWINPSPQLELF